jgi:hypothetical protein
METAIGYYFEHLDEFPFPSLFDGFAHPWEPLEKVKELIDELLVNPTSGKCAVKCWHLQPFRKLFCRENTVMYNGVTKIGPAYIGRTAR